MTNEYVSVVEALRRLSTALPGDHDQPFWWSDVLGIGLQQPLLAVPEEPVYAQGRLSQAWRRWCESYVARPEAEMPQHLAVRHCLWADNFVRLACRFPLGSWIAQGLLNGLALTLRVGVGIPEDREVAEVLRGAAALARGVGSEDLAEELHELGNAFDGEPEYEIPSQE